MSKDNSKFVPYATPERLANGDSVVRLMQNGEVVGEINFTTIMRNILGPVFGIGAEEKKGGHGEVRSGQEGVAGGGAPQGQGATGCN
jgi:hypothetical protein